jgi:hypothetical protein
MFTSAVVSIVVRNTIFRKAPPSVVSGYDKRSINLNKAVATFEKDKSRPQKLCKRAQKISAAAPLRVMASRYNPCELVRDSSVV